MQTRFFLNVEASLLLALIYTKVNSFFCYYVSDKHWNTLKCVLKLFGGSPTFLKWNLGDVILCTNMHKSIGQRKRNVMFKSMCGKKVLFLLGIKYAHLQYLYISDLLGEKKNQSRFIFYPVQLQHNRDTVTTWLCRFIPLVRVTRQGRCTNDLFCAIVKCFILITLSRFSDCTGLIHQCFSSHFLLEYTYRPFVSNMLAIYIERV